MPPSPFLSSKLPSLMTMRAPSPLLRVWQQKKDSHPLLNSAWVKPIEVPNCQSHCGRNRTELDLTSSGRIPQHSDAGGSKTVDDSARCNNYFFCMSHRTHLRSQGPSGKACPTTPGLKYTWPLLVGPSCPLLRTLWFH